MKGDRYRRIGEEKREPHRPEGGIDEKPVGISQDLDVMSRM